jgi:hypothetical protein
VTATQLLHRALRRVSGWPVAEAVEWAARLGYGARGFVYLSVGVLTLLASLDQIGSAVGSSGAAGWIADQPLGRVWLILLGLGLWLFVLWRVLQAVCDADHEGADLKGWSIRAGQALSGLFYALLASTVFEYLDEYGPRPAAEDVAENQDKAAALMDLPFGQWLIVLAGLLILAVGLGNVLRAWKDRFTEELKCSEEVCRIVRPLARLGYAARGFAYLPLAVFVILAGLNADVSEVTSFGEALDALEAQPGGPVILATTAAGLIAFGAFAFVEARWRRIRAPKQIT